jgi:uncharacterized protein (TIGR00299 family) protein
MILAANLPTRAADWSLAVFRQLAVAEGAVHGIGPEKVHFHEVGAVDAIVDIVGTCLSLDWLGIDSDQTGLPLVYCSAFPTGGGTVRAAHGRMPVPVPAVLKLWEMTNCPVYSNGIDRELVTPTGAAIATTLARSFGSPPPMVLKQVGLGAGSLDLPIPNILRIWVGETSPDHLHVQHIHKLQVNDADPHPGEGEGEETICVLETQIDDLSPQAIGYVFEALFTAGAVEVIFRETTTLGIRYTTQQRHILQRDVQTVQTPYGQVAVKIAWQGKTSQKVITNVQPEYEDCANLARQHHLPWREIQRLALHHWYANHPQESVSPPT